MKFRKIHLLAYGPFSDRTLNFGVGDANFHVIYGPNEAGKSSSLRAITDFLYGIPARTPDDFVHPYNKLRIGAVLEHSDGTQLHATRRKSNQNSLRCGNDTEVIDESQLSQLLGSLSKELFQTLHGLNHERLRLGGESIVRGTGHIGALLFASAAGLSDLRPLQSKLASETDQLMTSTGRSGAIPEKIKQWKDLQTEAKEAQLSVEEWNALSEKLAAYEREKIEVESALADLHAQLSRLQRISAAVPISTRLLGARSELEKVASAPDLPEDFVDQVHELTSKQKLQLLACKQTESLLEQRKNEIGNLRISEKILSAKLTISGLRAKYGGIQKFQEDLPKRVAERDASLSKCGEILQRLGHKRDIADLQQIFLTDSERVHIQELGMELPRLQAEEANAKQDLARMERKLSQLQEAIGKNEQEVNVVDLDSEIGEAQKDGDLDAKISKLREEILKLESEAFIQLRQLLPWQGTLRELEELPLPSYAIIGEFQKKFQGLEEERKVIQSKIHQLQMALVDDFSAIQELERDREVLSFESLHASRKHRETLWSVVVEAWLRGQIIDSDNLKTWKQFNLHSDDPESLKRLYEMAVKNADDIADGLREDADIIAKKTGTQLSILRNEKLVETQLDYLSKNCSLTERVKEEWRELWSTCGIDAKSAQEMLDWRQQADKVRELASKVRSSKIDGQNLEQRIDTHVKNILRELATIDNRKSQKKSSMDYDSLDLRDEAMRPTLTSVLRVAKRKLAEVQKEISIRTVEVANRIAAIEEFESAKQKLEQCQQAMQSWQTTWATQMKRLNLGPDATPREAESVSSNLQQIYAEYNNANQLSGRIEKMNNNIREFRGELNEIVARLAPELLGVSDEEMVTSLDSLRAKNELDQGRFEEKQTEILNRQQLLTNERNELDRINAKISLLCEQAQCTDASKLLDIGQMAEQKRFWRTRVRESEEQLTQLSAGLDQDHFLESIKDELDQVDQHPAMILAIKNELDSLSSKRDNILGDVRECSAQLARWNGSGIAAEKIAQSEGLAVEVADMARRLAVLRMGSVLLNSAIELHRKKNQAPVLSRASDLFRQLTCGGFQGLQTDYDEQGPVLMAERSTGERIPLSGLSEGTADQLYLSLRIASLEEWLKRHEAVPFIVDDILITFDDDRCAAALKILQELANQTQVLFFTHHQHIVDLAHVTISKSSLQTHTIAG